KGIDDGVLIVVAKDDRRIWIVTGRGAEGPLPDATVKRIVEEDITPRFKQGDFYGGIYAGADRIMHVLEGEPLPPPKRAARQLPPFGPFEWFVPGLFALLIAHAVLNALFGRALGSALTGGATGVLAWLVLGSLLIGVFVGFLAFVFSLFSSAFQRGGGWSSGGG